MSSFATGSLFLILSRAFSSFAGAAIGIIVARFLGPAKKGELAILTVITSWLQQLVELGMGPAITYYAAAENWPPHWLLLRSVLLSSILWMLSMIAILAFSAPITATFNLPAADRLFLEVLVAILPLLVFAEFFRSLLRGKLFFIEISFLEFIRAACGLLLLTILLAALGMGLEGVVYARITTAFIFFALALFLFALRRPAFKRSPPRSQPVLAAFLNYAIAYQVIRILGFLAMRVDTLFLGYFRGPRETGIYSVSLVGTEIVPVFSAAISQALLPRIASLSPDKAASFFPAVHRLGTSGALVLLLLGIPAARLIPILWGKAFRASVPPFYILLAAMPFFAGRVYIQNFLLGRRLLGPVIFLVAFTSSSEALLDLLLIPPYGACGAAAAYAITGIFSWLLGIFLLLRVHPFSIAALLLVRGSDLRLIIKRLRPKSPRRLQSD